MDASENLNDNVWDEEIKETRDEVRSVSKQIVLIARNINDKSYFPKFGSIIKALERLLDAKSDALDLYGYYDPQKEQAYKQNLLANLKKQVLELNKLLKILDSILASLVSKRSDTPVTNFKNFVSKNKLPTPDDEDSKRKKLPILIAQELAVILDLTDKEMAHILTISIRTYHRLKLNGLLNPVASERLMLLKGLAEFGLEVFEDQNNFNKWLRLPIRELSDISPLDSLDTAIGFNHVKTVLERIEYGVYS